MTDSTATISIGSNADDAVRRLLMGAADLSMALTVKGATRVFVTPDIHEAVDFRPPKLARRRYANAVIEAEVPRAPLTAASAEGLGALLKELERNAGRRPGHKAAGLVLLDLDAVTFGGRIIRPADFLRPYYHPWALTL